MNDTWLTERLEALADTPGPAAPPVSEVVLTGRRVRARRHRAVGAGAAVVLVAAAVSGVAVAGHTGKPRPVTLGAGPAPTPGDEGLTASYWFTSYVETDHQSVDGVDKATVQPAVDTWYGNNRRGVSGMGPADQPTGVESAPGPVYTDIGAGNKVLSRFDLSKNWATIWAAPTDQAGLKEWLKTQRGAVNGAVPVTAAQMLTQPAPLALRRALVDLLSTLPGATLAQGADDEGRPAQVVTLGQGADAQATVYYVDPATAKLLETKYVNGKPTEPSDLPQGSVDFQDVYSTSGPVDTAPVVPVRTKSAPEVIAPNTTGTPTCTAGKPDDPGNAVAVQLAKICLPDPAAGFPVRVDPDNYGDAIARAFVVAKAPKSPDTIRLQLAANDQYFMSLASTPTPDADGKVGATTFVASTTALGVTASEVTQRDGSKMLVLEKDGLGIEAAGSGSTTFADLVNVVDQVQGLGPA